MGVAFAAMRSSAFTSAKIALADAPPFLLLGAQFMVAGPVAVALTLAPIGFAVEHVADIRPTPSLLVSFLYTALIPGVLATVIWFRLVARIGPTAASAVHFLNPALGVAIAALLLGEGVGWLDVLGVAIVTIGIVAVQVSSARAARGA